jgi:hypothetical protein
MFPNNARLVLLSSIVFLFNLRPIRLRHIIHCNAPHLNQKLVTSQFNLTHSTVPPNNIISHTSASCYFRASVSDGGCCALCSSIRAASSSGVSLPSATNRSINKSIRSKTKKLITLQII